MAGNAAVAGQSVTSKVTAILMTFTGGKTYSLTELARLTGLPLSTTHRIAGELAFWRLLERSEDGAYRIGFPLRMISGDSDRGPSLDERAPLVLEDLANVTGRRARLGVLDGSRVRYIEKLGDTPVSSFATRTTLPAHATAIGKALLAYAAPKTVEQLLAGGLKAFTPFTLTGHRELRHALSLARRTYVATAQSELQLGVSAVAVPVCGPGGQVIAAFEVEVNDVRADLRSIRPILTVAARSLSRELATG